MSKPSGDISRHAFGAGLAGAAALSFLGAGVPPTTPTWGNMMPGA